MWMGEVNSPNGYNESSLLMSGDWPGVVMLGMRRKMEMNSDCIGTNLVQAPPGVKVSLGSLRSLKTSATRTTRRREGVASAGRNLIWFEGRWWVIGMIDEMVGVVLMLLVSALGLFVGVIVVSASGVLVVAVIVVDDAGPDRVVLIDLRE